MITAEQSSDRLRVLIFEDGLSAYAAATVVADELSPEAVRELALDALVVDAVRMVRGSERDARRTALGPVPEEERPVPSGGRRLPRTVNHGTKRASEEYGCECEACERAAAWREESQTRYEQRVTETISGLVEKLRDDLRAEWTAELLESTFGMPDGRRVTWAEATIEDHREHVAMIERQVHGQVRDLVLHQQAISELQTAGASCLGELVSVGTP